jgi:hypothetical protein
MSGSRLDCVGDHFDQWAVEFPALPEQWHIQVRIGDWDQGVLG